MKAANILLALVALLCGLSSLIPQGRELPFYAENYPGAYTLIYRTHFYDVFSSWYFVLLMGLLCLSLLVCSLRMFRRSLRSSREGVQQAAALLSPNSEIAGPPENRNRLSRVTVRTADKTSQQMYWSPGVRLPE